MFFRKYNKFFRSPVNKVAFCLKFPGQWCLAAIVLSLLILVPIQYILTWYEPTIAGYSKFWSCLRAFLNLSCNDYQMLMDNLLKNPVVRVKGVWHLEMSLSSASSWILIQNYLFKYSNPKRISRAHMPQMYLLSNTYFMYSVAVSWSGRQANQPRKPLEVCSKVLWTCRHPIVIVQSQRVQIFDYINKKLQIAWQHHHSMLQNRA